MKGRSPYGERGLKLEVVVGVYFRLLSLSLRRAWIEIQSEDVKEASGRVALLTESVD